MAVMKTETLSIEGMHCDHCVDAVRSALQSLDGVSVGDVSVGTATVDYDRETVTQDDLAAAIRDAGYDLAS